jgi:tetratricopeptide (TPR) repeat protein
MAKPSRPRRTNRTAARLPVEWDRASIVQALILVAAVFAVFWPARNGQWIGDDYLYIVTNDLMDDPARIWKAWFVPGSFVEYYPVEQTVQWIQWQLWRTDTFGYHLTNIALHALSALLLWRLLRKLGVRLAWLGALIFAVHPMTVDSVALVNELKASLSLPPFLLAMSFYIDYEDRGRARDYRWALALFLIAMLCKITMAPFPLVMLLYAWWKRDRLAWRDVRAAAPFFAVSLTLGLVTIWAGEQYDHAPAGVTVAAPVFPWAVRVPLIGQIIAFYFSRVVLPIAPIPVYSKWPVDPAAPLQYLPLAGLVAVLVFLWLRRASWGRNALLGLGFFLIMLAPFSGVHWVSYMRVTWILEHLLYIPMLGLIALAAAALGEVERQLPAALRPVGVGVVSVAVALLALQSYLYAGQYVNEETLCTYTLAHDPASWEAHEDLGHALVKQGRTDEAMAQFQQALALNPDFADAHYCLGVACGQRGQYDAAIAHYEKALAIDPSIAEAQLNLGNALMQTGQAADAIVHYHQALAIRPAYADAHNNLGEALLQKGQLDAALGEFQQALQERPAYADAHNNLGIVYAQTNRLDAALAQFREAVRLDPANANAQRNLAAAEQDAATRANAGRR